MKYLETAIALARCVRPDVRASLHVWPFFDLFVSVVVCLSNSEVSVKMASDSSRENQQRLLEVIKQRGPCDEAQRMMQTLVDEMDVDTIILGCTEFPLVPVRTDKRLVDPTTLLSRSLASLALGLTVLAD